MEAFRVTDDEEVVKNPNCLCNMTLTEWSLLEKQKLASDYPQLFAVDDDKTVADIIRPPNADDADVASISRAANQGRRTTAVKFPLGKLVPVGHIKTVHNAAGQAEVLTAGRYAMRLFLKGIVPAATWGKLHSLTQNHITEGTFTMVRVSRGQIGLAVENGKPVLLAEGLHVYNSVLFTFKEFKEVSSEHIEHMSCNVIRVPKGSFGKVMEQGRPKLLPEGTHAIDNPVFKYDGLVETKQHRISYGSIHILQVASGTLALIKEGNFPSLLHEGLHIYNSPMLEICATQNKNTSMHFQHGTITRFRVQKGEIGLAVRNNEPLFIEEPGTYQVNSASFKFEYAAKASDKSIVLGSSKIITVYSGEVGVSYNGGRLQVLQPGRHVIDKAEHTFDDFLSTQQKSMRLKQHTESKLTAPKEDMLVCETKDLVRIGVRADVFFRIADPEKAILQVGRDQVDVLVMETSVATITNIIRSTALNEIAQNGAPSAGSEKAEATKEAQALRQPSAPVFFDKVHDVFLAKLHDDFVSRYGIEISNIRIEQFKIVDEALAKSISQQALTTAETESQLANLEGQTQIATQQQERDAKILQIRAQSEADARRMTAEAEVAQAEGETKALQVRAEAEANRIKVKAQSDAEAIRIRAEASIAEARAEAEGVRIRAAAEAESLKLKATAEGERAQLLASSPLGEKLALLGIYAETVKSSNDGVQKVVYVDPSTTAAANPLSLLTLQSLQRDLASLQTGTSA